MNERIRELRKQAIDYCLDKGSQGNLSEEVAEKFAELIIQQCIDICEAEKADYIKHRKSAYDFEEKQIYAEGEAACDTIKGKLKRMLK